MKKFTCIIIDDEPLAREIISDMLKEDVRFDEVAQCSNGFEGAKTIVELKPDLIFLDVQMPKINGFEMLEILDQKPAVIFTTAFDEFAMKAFENNAVDYLLKPIHQKKFTDALDKAIKLIQHENTEDKTDAIINEGIPESKNRVVVKIGNKIKIIPTQDIRYIESYDDYVKIYSADEMHIKKKTMSFYESNLDSSIFVRIHRSYIVNINCILKLEHDIKDNYICILRTGEKLQVSRQGYGKLREVLGW